MNKSEKVWAALLAVGLLAYLGWQMLAPKPEASLATAIVKASSAPAAQVQPVAAAQAPVATPSQEAAAAPVAPEQLLVLKNEEVALTVSTHGARVVKAELLKYRAENREDSPHVTLQTGDLLGLQFGAGAPWAVYEPLESPAGELRLQAHLANGIEMVRTLRLGEHYAVEVFDAFTAAQATTLPAHTLSAGAMALGTESGDVLGVDVLPPGESKPIYLESELGKILGARKGFLGCGTSSDPAGVPLMGTRDFPGSNGWVALKNRFFVALLSAPSENIQVAAMRDGLAKQVKVNRVQATLSCPELAVPAGTPHVVMQQLYVGPKQLSSLSAFGRDADRVMDFGFFGWVCKLLLPILNGFYWLIPNYGVAIILLTLLVRVVFWPLTHKSTVAMRKMSVIQPQIKALQQQFKDQPQKIQQETFKLYREHKVNPFSSCLPMLVQIPIFFALFVVLRSAVELRFASFLWISDLSQPENLLAGVLPVPLNILPILTAVTMGLQTALSPSTGDAAQKKMMTWMMPIMLLFMFYSMPSALCLYWTVSQGLSILQMWQIRRKAGDGAAA